MQPSNTTTAPNLWDQYKPLWIYLIVQAVLGIILVEFALSRFKRFMEQDEARDANFPAFRRYDAPHWNRLMFYPGAITILIPRILLFLVNLFLIVILINLALIGSSDETGQRKIGCRQNILNFIYHHCGKFLMFTCGFWTY